MIVQYVSGGSEPGRVTHVVSVHAKNYPAMLTDLGLTFLHLDAAPDFDALGQGYVQDGSLHQRPAMNLSLSKTAIAADDEDEAVLSGLPDPCVVHIDETPVEVTGGELRITSTMPATYEIAINIWPYLPWSAAIVAE